MIEGGCRCGAIRYQVEGAMEHHALCHCRDCQMASGAPMVGWMAFKSDAFRLTAGKPVSYSGNGSSVRYFCGTCGTPVYFENAEMLPGIVDIQSVTLDDPDVFPPQAHIQVAERRKWMENVAQLPEFARFPGGPES